MAKEVGMKIIARIRTDFPTKFGIPRQSGLIQNRAQIVFEPEYRNPEALRGIEGYSHLWLIWQFSEAVREDWSPTVRPPRLGGNKGRGVFATRSPFRPNAIGLSSVQLEGVDWEAPNGPVLVVSGADLMDQTPIFDIKPYLAFTDSHPEARDGFAGDVKDNNLTVEDPKGFLSKIPGKSEEIRAILSQDPRPHYQNQPDRVYGLPFSEFEIKFSVKDNTLTVLSVENCKKKEKV